MFLCKNLIYQIFLLSQFYIKIAMINFQMHKKFKGIKNEMDYKKFLLSHNILIIIIFNYATFNILKIKM